MRWGWVDRSVVLVGLPLLPVGVRITFLSDLMRDTGNSLVSNAWAVGGQVAGPDCRCPWAVGPRGVAWSGATGGRCGWRVRGLGGLRLARLGAAPVRLPPEVRAYRVTTSRRSRTYSFAIAKLGAERMVSSRTNAALGAQSYSAGQSHVEPHASDSTIADWTSVLA
ncbi:hypothetical protein TNCT6_61500 [Streptomyces sp. 6-11-2]|nr:hypothetical protein TNCT6_61500 [Streptomyces sp. 6-11-2]